MSQRSRRLPGQLGRIQCVAPVNHDIRAAWISMVFLAPRSPFAPVNDLFIAGPYGCHPYPPASVSIGTAGRGVPGAEPPGPVRNGPHRRPAAPPRPPIGGPDPPRGQRGRAGAGRWVPPQQPATQQGGRRSAGERVTNRSRPAGTRRPTPVAPHGRHCPGERIGNSGIRKPPRRDRYASGISQQGGNARGRHGAYGNPYDNRAELDEFRHSVNPLNPPSAPP